MRRFVILHHVMPEGSPRETHWDLMLENSGELVTWALSQEPRGGLACRADRLPNHRLEYLTYRGPVSNHRGTVSSFDEGVYELHEATSVRSVVELHGRLLQARLTFTRADNDDTERMTQEWHCVIEPWAAAD